MSADETLIVPGGPFTLASAARWFTRWEPATGAAEPDGETIRLGFLVDDWSGYAGVLVRQDANGGVRARITHSTAADPGRVIDQACRVLSLDHDATGYAALGERDPVLAALLEQSGHMRPVLFHSPYEQACWAVISTRLRQTQAAVVRDRLSRLHGGEVDVEGTSLLSFPAPAALLDATEVEGLADVKLERLHAIARAAIAGFLDAERLRALATEEAEAELRTLPGIGPFWASGIVMRSIGAADALMTGEPRVRARAAAVYERPELATDDDAFVALAQTWRPWRTWVSVLLRATG